MSEHTPTTGDVRAAYNQLITATRPHELPHDYPCPEFDRWLAQHEDAVRRDYRDRVLKALTDKTKYVGTLGDNIKYLDTSDPATDGFVTAFNQFIEALDSQGGAS